jgi:hypothetical protein
MFPPLIILFICNQPTPTTFDSNVRIMFIVNKYDCVLSINFILPFESKAAVSTSHPSNCGGTLLLPVRIVVFIRIVIGVGRHCSEFKII